MDGDLWVPASFHGEPNTMPMCPGEFMLPMPVEIGASAIPGLSLRRADPLHRIRRASLYLGDFDVDLLREFFQGFVNHAQVTVHLDSLRGSNAHHQAETLFKAFGRALRMAVTEDPRMKGQIPSTKGTL